MKRALAFTLMVLAIMIIAVSCEEPQAQVHEHTYAEEWSHDDTFHWHASACGHEEEVSDKSVHVWKEGGDEDGWIVDVESTEKEEGKKHRECSVCGYKEEGKVPLKGHVHTFSAYDHNGSKHWRTCTGCGEKFTYSHSLTYKYNANTHYQTCYCGYSTTEASHTFETSASDGSTLKTCTVCKYQETLTKQTETTTTVSEIAEKAGGVTETTATDEKGNEITVQIPKAEVKIAADVIATETDPTTAEGETAATTVSFPEGALKIKEGAEEVKLTVIAAPVTVASLNGSGYQITTNSEEASETTADTSKAVVAGFEFKLEGAVATDLKGTNNESGNTGKKVGTEITTWITPGLGNKENLTIQYVGNKTSDDNGYLPTIKSYDTSNGKLTFIVYHFSKYIILSTDKKIMDDQGEMYTGFADEDLKKNLKNGSTLTLLADVELTDAVSFSKTVTLNLNGKKVDLNSTTMSVESKSTVTITDCASGQTPLIASGAKVASGSSAVNGTYYPSLEKAIENVQANSTVVLLEKIDNLSSTIDVDKTMTLDLNDKTITAKTRVFLVKKGTLTIQNGTISADIKTIGSSVIRVSSESGNAGVVLKSGATIKAPSSYGITAFGPTSNTATLDIYGTIESANPCLGGDGSSSSDNCKVTMNVYDGAVLTQDSSTKEWTESTVNNDPVAIYQPNPGVLNIKGGTITSVNGSAIEIRAGEATISEGTLTGSNSYKVRENGNGRGPTVYGAAVAVSQHTTKKNINVTISGGKFNGAKQLAIVNPQENAVEYTKNVKAIVKSNVTLSAVVGHTVDTTGTKTYYINRKSAIANGAGCEAKVGDKYYESFEDAVHAAVKSNTDKTVEVLVENITLKGAHRPEVNGSVTINANGATFSGGENDISVYTYASENISNYKDDTSGTVNIVINDAKNLRVWGQGELVGNNQTINITMNNCSVDGEESKFGLVMLRGADDYDKGKVNIKLNNCIAENGTDANSAVHTNIASSVEVKGCTFEKYESAVNIVRDRLGDVAVTVENCTFTGCGKEEEITKGYYTPIRVVNKNSDTNGKMTATIKNNTVSGTKSTKLGDILLVDSRVTNEVPKSWYGLTATIINNGSQEIKVRNTASGKLLTVSKNATQTMTVAPTT